MSMRFRKENLASIISKVLSKVVNGRIEIHGKSGDTAFELLVNVVNLTITSCSLKISNSSIISGVDCLNMMSSLICSECSVYVSKLFESTDVGSSKKGIKVNLKLCHEVFPKLSSVLRYNRNLISELLKPTSYVGGSAGRFTDVINNLRDILADNVVMLYIRAKDSTYYVVLANGFVVTALKYIKRGGFSLGYEVIRELESMGGEVVAIAFYKVNVMKLPKHIRTLILECLH